MFLIPPDGTRIQAPIDQMIVDSAQQIYKYQPGAAKKITELPAGQNCVQVTASRIDGNGSAPPYTWCFTVV
jgi:hypothetical protein